MGRIRSAKPELLDDEKAATLADDAWRLWVSSWLLADDYGNFRADAQLVQSRVFWGRPGVPPDTAALLRLLGELEFFEFYSVRGQRYAHIRTWRNHQKVDHPGKPLCPGPDLSDQGPNGSTVGERSTDSRGSREDRAPDRDLDQDQEKDQEKEKEGNPREGARKPGSVDTSLQNSTPDPRQPHSPPDLFEATLGSFNLAWKIRYGVDYKPTPKDRAQLGRFLQTLTRDEAAALPDLFLGYLRDEDPFVADKQRHSLTWFVSGGGWNKHRTKAPAPAAKGSAREREERNGQAAASWLRRKRGGGNAGG